MNTEKKIKRVEIDINSFSRLPQEELNTLRDIFEKFDNEFVMISHYLFSDSNQIDDILGAVMAEQLKRETQKRDIWELACK